MFSKPQDVYTDRTALGELNAREFGDLCDAFIYASPETEHAHNSLILAVMYNASKDKPEPGVAEWVEGDLAASTAEGDES